MASDYKYQGQFDDNQELLKKIQQQDLRESHSIVSFADLKEKGWEFKQRVHEGYNVPWNMLKDKLMFVKGELTIISGYTGQGKSEVATNLALFAIEQGAKAYIASTELESGHIFDRIAQHATGCTNHTQEYYEAIANHYADKLAVYDRLGVMDLDKILEGAQRLCKFFGYDFFVIDNLMMLDTKVDDYNKQLEHIQKISAFAKENHICILLVAHSRKPLTKASHGPLMRVFSPPGIHEILGASSVGNLIDNHFSVTINYTKKLAQDKLDRGDDCLTNSELQSLKEGDTILLRDKKREHGDFFYQSLYYDERFRRLKSSQYEKCKRYVDYSRHED